MDNPQSNNGLIGKWWLKQVYDPSVIMFPSYSPQMAVSCYFIIYTTSLSTMRSILWSGRGIQGSIGLNSSVALSGFGGRGRLPRHACQCEYRNEQQQYDTMQVSLQQRGYDDDVLPGREKEQAEASPRSINQVACQLKFVIPNALTGCIIGKNGANLERIQAESGAFIQANAPGYAVMSMRERFIIIAGDSMEQCLRGLELVFVSMIEANKESILRKSIDGRLYLRQVIPGVCAGNVIGLQGATVARISQETGLSVVVEPKTMHAAIAPFRIVSYAGMSVQELVRGVRAVVQIIESDVYNAEIKEIKSVVLKAVEIPAGRVGALIGPKGTHLKALEDILKCKLVISRSETDDGEKKHYLTVWGQPESVKAAIVVAQLHSRTKIS